MEDFVNMKYVINIIKNRSSDEISSEKKIREKLIEMFDIIDVDRNLLKKGQKSVKDYLFPRKSLDFLCWLYDFYLSEDGKELRRGNVQHVEIKSLEAILDGIKEMYEGIGLDERILSNELERIMKRLHYNEIVAKRKILDALQEIVLDFNPTEPLYNTVVDAEGNSRSELGRFRIPYHYDKLGEENILVLLEFIHNDILKREQLYRELYYYLNEEYELEEDCSFYSIMDMMETEEFSVFSEKMEDWLEFRKMLVEDERYKELMSLRDDICREKAFAKQKAPRVKEIDEKIKALEKDIEKEYFAGRSVELPEPICKYDGQRLTLERCEELLKTLEKQSCNKKKS